MRFFTQLLAIAVAVTGVSSIALADAEEAYDAAFEYYSERDGSPEFKEKMKELFTVALETAIEEEDEDYHYQSLILKSRSQYWFAKFFEEADEKAEQYERAAKTAEKAQDVRDDLADGYYFWAIAMARSKEDNPLGGLFLIPKLRKTMDKAKNSLTFDGDQGFTIDSYGPDRTLGKVNLEVRATPFGSLSKAREQLELAWSEGFENSLNAIYMAEVYFADDETKQMGCDVLFELIDAVEEDGYEGYNEDRIPETKEDVAKANEYIEDKGCERQ